MQDNIRSYRTRFLKKYDTFPDDFVKKRKDNANETINITIEVKNDINQIATEQGFSAMNFKSFRCSLTTYA